MLYTQPMEMTSSLFTLYPSYNYEMALLNTSSMFQHSCKWISPLLQTDKLKLNSNYLLSSIRHRLKVWSITFQARKSHFFCCSSVYSFPFVCLFVCWFFSRVFFSFLQYFSRDFKHIMAKPYLNFQQLSDWPTVLQVKKCCHFVQNENVIKIIRSNVTSECLSLMKIMKNPKQASKQICPFNLKCWKCGMKCVRGEWIVVKQSTDKFYFVWHQKLNYYTFFVIRFE